MIPLKELRCLLKSAVQAMLLRRNSPFAFRWNITERCLRTCVYCNVDTSKETDELDTKQAKALIDQIASNIIYITISGGEPMLRQDIGEIIGYARDRGIRHIQMVSSGHDISKRIDELSRVSRLVLSIEGSEAVHDMLRGEGSYSEVIEAAGAASKHGIKVCLNAVLMKQNLGEIPFLVKLSSRIKAPITFEPIFQATGSKDMAPFYPSSAEYSKAIEEITRIKNADGALISNSEGSLEFIKSWPEYAPMRCAAGRLFCIIRSDGSLQSCDHINYADMASETQGLNILNAGFDKAVAAIKSPICKGCGCEGSLQLSRIMNLSPSFLSDTRSELARLRE
ncbi:MAG: radical SAM protein [Candidatus Omnitrophica bacterium]|nr:radical SAM protein [Candidatus Omnitrophota bacterium]